MNDKTTQKAIPPLRFPEFKDAGEWVEKPLGRLSNIIRGGSPRPIDRFITSDKNGLNWLKIGDVAKEAKYITKTQEKVTEDALSKTREVKPGDLIMSNSMSFGRPYILKIKSCIHDGWIAISEVEEDISVDYLYYIILSEYSQRYFQSSAAGSGVRNLNVNIIKLLPISLPNPAEQQKIAECLSSIDALINAEKKKEKQIQKHKKALMQKLFPSQNETIPKIRFPEFQNKGEWEMKPLGNFLGYQQPTAYLVSDTKYSDAYKTPVLTAGKTFILGYTNEQDGIFEDNLPVIIFDDFTTATKFVDFPFKAKSSAMKILQAKDGANIKFMYETMQMISYEVGGHERHWISKFAPMLVPIPIDPKEQKKIAECLSSVDALIDAQAEKIKTLEEHKKGLMQQLFPSTEEATE